MAIYKTLPDGHKKLVVCAGKCCTETQHSVLANVADKETHHYIQYRDDYQIIQCDGCGEISFLKSKYCSEDGYYDANGDYEPNESVLLFPVRVADSRGLGFDIAYLPRSIRLLYEETRNALLNSSPVLTGIGLRALVESVCKQKDVSGKDLEQKINKLAEIRVLNDSQLKILHLIRALGNKAAHEVKPHSAEQLALAMNVVENLLAGVYIMPMKVSKLFRQEELEAAQIAERKKKEVGESGKSKISEKSKKHQAEYEKKIALNLSKMPWVLNFQDLSGQGGGVTVVLKDGFSFLDTLATQKTFVSIQAAHAGTIKKSIKHP